MKNNFSTLTNEIINCSLCERLVEHRNLVSQKKRRAFLSDNYWGKPVPSFGEIDSSIFILGLAPGAHGSNRTGRMFTGDSSGNLLYRILFDNGLCTQPTSSNIEDGLQLINCYISAVVRCAPPKNKPSIHEIQTCRRYLLQEIRLLNNLKVIVALGKIAFDQYIKCMKLVGISIHPKPLFGHNKIYTLSNGVTLISCYHPSQQNTLTGRLTPTMFNDVFKLAKSISQQN